MEALYEMFRQLQDDIYYPGYCLDMETAYPEKTEFEWQQFLKMYSK